MKTIVWYWKCPVCKIVEYCPQEEAMKLADKHDIEMHSCKNVYQMKTAFGWEKITTNN